MNTSAERKALASSHGGVPTEIRLGPSPSLDLSGLREEERRALLMDHARQTLVLKRRAAELGVDAEILKTTLDDLSEVARRTSEAGAAVTISHTQTTTIGRTEVLMGNTERAYSGRLTKSQTGEKDWTPYYIFAAIVALVLIVVANA